MAMKVISERIENGYIITEGIASNGVGLTLREPVRTAEERNEAWSGFARAAAKMVYPDLDIDSIKTVRLLGDNA